MKRLFTLLFLFIPFVVLAEQPHHWFKHLDMADGLSDNYVTALAQDKRGFIWIATESGLSRFDGSNFQSFTTANSAMPSNRINSLYYDEKNDALWMTTNLGLCSFDCRTLSIATFFPPLDMYEPLAYHVTPASDGGLWITFYHGILHLNPKTGEWKRLHKNLDYCHCAYDDGRGHVYVGHFREGLSVVNLADTVLHNFRHEENNAESLAGDFVYVINQDAHEGIWIGTNQGLSFFDGLTGRFVNFRHKQNDVHSLISDHIYGLSFVNGNQLWVASDIGGISILNLSDLRFTRSSDVSFARITKGGSEDALSSANVRSVMQDSYGNVWVGNYSSGLDVAYHKQPLFRRLPYRQWDDGEARYSSVWGIYADSIDNTVWLGCENELVVYENQKQKGVYSILPQLTRSYGQAFAIGKSKGDKLLLGIYDNGLLEFDRRTHAFKRLPLEDVTTDVLTFYTDRSGVTDTIWIGTEWGLYSYCNGKVQRRADIDGELPSRCIYGVVRDPKGYLWLGTIHSGLFCFSPQNKLVINLSSPTGFPSDAINSLFLDSQGALWAATRKGLVCIPDLQRPMEYLVYNEKNGLADTHVRAVQEDLSGNLWISTYTGVARLDKGTGRFRNYDSRDGLPMTNFIEGATCRLPDGTIYFGSMAGACFLDPSLLTLPEEVNSLVLKECRVLGNDEEVGTNEGQPDVLVTSEDVQLDYAQNSLRLSFSVPDVSQNELLEYAYRMDGLEEVWHNTNGENYVIFRNLAPGSYKFRVKARLKNGTWNETQALLLPIRINPPLWLTWYAKLFYALCVLAMALLLARYIMYRLRLKTSLELERRNSLAAEQLNQERLRFFTNITHELRTPLTLILGPLEDMQADATLSQQHRNEVNLIKNNADHLLELINQLLDFRKTETQNRQLVVCHRNLTEVVREMVLRFQELNRNEKITVLFNADEEDIFTNFDADVVTTILTNLLTNALKYTPEGQVEITIHRLVEEETKRVEIQVKDTGYGISAADLPHIFERYYQGRGSHQASGTGIGLALVHALADLHQATLSVQSVENVGSTFTLCLDADNLYPNALHADEETLSAEEAKKTAEEEEPEDPIAAETSQTNILLVVEDNRDICDYIAHSFSDTYKVLVAYDGGEGLSLAQTHIPNLIITDVMMPVMDGLQLCKSLKADMRTCHIPIIMLTAKDTNLDRELGYRTGADSYLVKPFSMTLLRSRVDNLFENHHRLVQQMMLSKMNINGDLALVQTGGAITSPLDIEFLNQITAIIEAHLQEDFDMGQLAVAMGMSYSSFYRKVKGVTGVSAIELTRKLRLRRSYTLLSEGRCNISEAAFGAGFNDLSYFRRLFREEFGVTPSEYLKQRFL